MLKFSRKLKLIQLIEEFFSLTLFQQQIKSALKHSLSSLPYVKNDLTLTPSEAEEQLQKQSPAPGCIPAAADPGTTCCHCHQSHPAPWSQGLLHTQPGAMAHAEGAGYLYILHLFYLRYHCSTQQQHAL